MTMNIHERINPATTALVVVDMQNDFCSPGGYLDKLGADLTAVEPTARQIARLLDSARSAGVKVVHIQSWFDGKYLNRPMLERLERFNIEPYCVSGSWGADFIDDLRPLEGEEVVVKHTYSAFQKTRLDDVLRDAGISTVVLCGTATNNCVDGTGRDAFYAGYHVVLAPDAACAPTAALHEHAIATAKHAYAVIAEVAEIEAAWAVTVNASQ